MENKTRLPRKSLRVELPESLIKRIDDTKTNVGTPKRLVCGAALYAFFMLSESKQRSLIGEYAKLEASGEDPTLSRKKDRDK